MSLVTDFKVIKLFSCSTQLGIKFILLINVKMPTVVGVGILTLMSRINYGFGDLNLKLHSVCGFSVIYKQLKYRLS